MIKDKNDLKKYLLEDKKQLGIIYTRPSLFGDEVWKFQIALRHLEYYINTDRNVMNLIKKSFWRYRHHVLGVKLGFTIPPGVFGPGLNIHHYGLIVVNAHAKVGANCNIQQGVNIGQNHTKEETPVLGDNIYIGPGAKIFGNITIADGITIGANSIVTKSFLKANRTIAGIPARYIGERKI